MSIIYILIGLVLLVIGGEYLVRSSVSLSFKFNVSKMIIGLTVVSFATSAPELLVSIQAAVDGHPSISLGNVVGSNIANIGLVLGITSIIGTLQVEKDFYRVHWPVMMLFSVLLFFFLTDNNVLDTYEGAILLLGVVGFIVLLVVQAIKKAKKGEQFESDEVDDDLADVGFVKILIWLAIGILALYYGSELLVEGAIDLANSLGVSERVIAVTMIAVGTSVPELAASVVAVLKKEESISIGNLIGSNIFNIGSVLGVTSIITPVKVISRDLLLHDLIWMLGFAFALCPIAYIGIKKKNKINLYKGLIIFLGYIAFVFVTFA